MNLLQWFHRYPAYETRIWLVITGAWVIWELQGFFRVEGTTFSDMVRAALPRNRTARMTFVGLACILLFIHFAVQKANYQ